MDALRALAARRRVDLDLALQRLVLIGEPHVALATAEQRLEDRAEVVAHLPERLQEHPLRGLIDRAPPSAAIGAVTRSCRCVIKNSSSFVSSPWSSTASALTG